MANLKISQLPEYSGNTSGSYLVMNNSGETTTYKVKKENYIFPYDGVATITGSLLLTGSLNVTSGSLRVSGSITQTGSLFAIRSLNSSDPSSITNLQMKDGSLKVSNDFGITSIECGNMRVGNPTNTRYVQIYERLITFISGSSLATFDFRDNELKITTGVGGGAPPPPGNVNILSPLTVSGSLKLEKQSPLPAGTVGSLAVSGSNLFYHNGSSWSQIN
jgi:hypothetical protein